MTNLQAWEYCWRGLGAKPSESIFDAAKRARYHGHERAAAAEILLASPSESTPDEHWTAMHAAARLLKPRVDRELELDPEQRWKRPRRMGGGDRP